MDEIDRRCLARELEVAIARMSNRATDARLEWVLHQGGDGDDERLYRTVTRRDRAMLRLVRALATLAGA